MSRSALHTFAIVVLASSLGACGSPTTPPTLIVSDPKRDSTVADSVINAARDSSISLARRRWAAARPSAYEYTLTFSCFCIPDFVRPVVVVVNGDTVMSRTYASDGAPVDSRWSAAFSTIDGLFAKIDSARVQRAFTLDVSYDGAVGYPTRVWIDYRSNVADEEILFSIANFRAR